MPAGAVVISTCALPHLYRSGPFGSQYLGTLLERRGGASKVQSRVRARELGRRAPSLTMLGFFPGARHGRMRSAASYAPRPADYLASTIGLTSCTWSAVPDGHHGDRREASSSTAISLPARGAASTVL